MKKTITLLSVALMACGNAVLANTSKEALRSKELTPAIFQDHSGYNELLGAKYVSFADAGLIATELGPLKKSAKTTAELIAEDLKITEGAVSAKPAFKKKPAKKGVTLKKVLSN